MGTGEYYGVSDSAERGSVELYGKSEAHNMRDTVHSSSHENVLEDEHPSRSDGLMRADNNAKGAEIIYDMQIKLF